MRFATTRSRMAFSILFMRGSGFFARPYHGASPHEKEAPMFFHARLHDYPVSRRTPELRAKHREYLARHASSLIARGAVQSDDAQTIRGSVFFGDFADQAEAEKFFAGEPFNRAGVYMSLELLRWSNPLERKAGAYTGKEGPNLWYIRGYAKPGMDAQRETLLKQHGAYLEAREAELVVRGGLFGDDGKTWMGSAMVLALPDRKAAETFAAEEPFCRNGLFSRVAIERCSLAGPDHG